MNHILKHRKLVQILLALIVAGAYFVTQRLEQPGATVGDDNTRLRQAIANQQSDVQVTGNAEVIKLLADDTRGSQHQRFLIRLDGGETILIAHNIDLAPRIDDLREGDMIRFNGEFEWNDKGGVIHWTHKDPRGHHEHGYLEHNGLKYW